jgi:hypothetical protein
MADSSARMLQPRHAGSSQRSTNLCATSRQRSPWHASPARRSGGVSSRSANSWT